MWNKVAHLVGRRGRERREGRREGKKEEWERERGRERKILQRHLSTPKIGFFQLALLSFYHFPAVASCVTL